MSRDSASSSSIVSSACDATAYGMGNGSHHGTPHQSPVHGKHVNTHKTAVTPKTLKKHRSSVAASVKPRLSVTSAIKNSSQLVATCKAEMLLYFKEKKGESRLMSNARCLLPGNVITTITNSPEHSVSKTLLQLLGNMCETRYRTRDAAGKIIKKTCGKRSSMTPAMKDRQLHIKLAFAVSLISKIVREKETPPLMVIMSAYLYAKGQLSACKGVLNGFGVTCSTKYTRCVYFCHVFVFSKVQVC
jgi:hypothetical protein